MCGRYAFARTDEIPSLFEIDEKRISPRFNIAPTQDVAIVRLDHDGKRKLDFVRWGLVPYWAKEPGKVPHINARMESISQKPLFRDAFEKRRCLVPADGFYEWKKTDGRKQPYFCCRKDRHLLAFAGVWERWRGSEGKWLRSCAIVTGPPNPLVAQLHDRMPVIVPSMEFREWLDPRTPKEVLEPILSPYPASEMKVFAVSTAVNHVDQDGPECLQEIGPTAEKNRESDPASWRPQKLFE